MQITEKEFAVIREISNNHLPDQRTIAHRAGISLGLTNLIIKRLVNKGYVKAKQLNRKKIQYLLTPKGFAEKAKKSYNFTLKTIGYVSMLREKIEELIALELKKGANEFVLSGNSELLDMAEQALAKRKESQIKYTRKPSSSNGQGTSIIAISKDQTRTIDVVSYLVESGLFYWK